MIKKLLRNPWLAYAPFLVYYMCLIFINKWPKLYGDEIRYVAFAKNLTHGFYSPPPPHIDLWNGPGYPLVLMPFVALHVPYLYVTLINALYLYLAVVLLYKAINRVANQRIAFAGSLLLALYPNAQSMLPILYTEPFTGLLVTGLIYGITLTYVKKSNGYIVFAGIILGFLVLTKVIFGYVLFISLAVALAVRLIRRNKFYAIRAVKILLIAVVVTLPYLTYTWRLTGKVFYWGNAGGMSLYWMSTPFENEYGDWKVPDLSNNQYPTLFKSPEVVSILKKNHAKELKFILSHNEVEQDALFKQKALENITQHPLKFIHNYENNLSRMLFNFPYSYSWQDAAIIGNIVIGSLTLWGTIVCIIVTVLNWRRVVYPVKFLLLIAAVYLSLSGALSAYPRQLDVIVPVLIFWAGYLAAKIKKPSLKFAEAEAPDEIELMDLTDIGVFTAK
jgi:hypothetical protein